MADGLFHPATWPAVRTGLLLWLFYRMRGDDTPKAWRALLGPMLAFHCSADTAEYRLEILVTTTARSNREDGAARTDLLQRQIRKTRSTFMTTEFITYVVAVVGVMIASMVVDGNGNGDNGAAGDYFRADRAWLYIVILTVGYMISRGLAKTGNRDNYNS